MRYQEHLHTEIQVVLEVILLAEALVGRAADLTVVLEEALEAVTIVQEEAVLVVAATAQEEVVLEVRVVGLHQDLLDPQEVEEEETKVEHLF